MRALAFNKKDALIIAVSLIILGLSSAVAVHNGMFTLSLAEDEQLTWHLIRSSGVFAYILLTASMVWGLFLSNHLIKNWSPGPVSMSIHSTLSWLGLLLGLFHALLLMVDDYFTYTLSDVFVPFAGPYRPEWVGLGTFAFWLLLLVSISFPLKKRIGQRNWKRLHYVSYGTYVMVTLHGLFAGTDAGLTGFRVMIGAGVLMVVLLTGARIRKKSPATSHHSGTHTTTKARRVVTDRT